MLCTQVPHINEHLAKRSPTVLRRGGAVVSPGSESKIIIMIKDSSKFALRKKEVLLNLLISLDGPC